HHVLRGENTKKIYRLGDRVRVQVVRVDMERRQIDLGLTEVLDAVRERRPRGPIRSAARPKKEQRRASRPGRRERQTAVNARTGGDSDGVGKKRRGKRR